MEDQQKKYSTAKARYQRVSPRKTRLVARNITGLGIDKATEILRFTPNKAARILQRLLKSAVSNAENASFDLDEMIVKEIVVNEGPSWKRFMPRAQGRASKIHKRTSHITVILSGEK
ncbi:MAG: 50S ribosomal protein L22 [Desulfovibrionaceae bacterium]|nr:50S ribosomal protein L22 [Desulfovibrionaceae bacterium]